MRGQLFLLHNVFGTFSFTVSLFLPDLLAHNKELIKGGLDSLGKTSIISVYPKFFLICLEVKELRKIKSCAFISFLASNAA